MKKQLIISIDLGKNGGMSFCNPHQPAKVLSYHGENFREILPVLRQFFKTNEYQRIDLITGKTIYRNHITTGRLGEYWGIIEGFLTFIARHSEIRKFELDENEIFRYIFQATKMPFRAEKKLKVKEKYLNRNDDIADSLMILDYGLKREYNKND